MIRFLDAKLWSFKRPHDSRKEKRMETEICVGCLMIICMRENDFSGHLNRETIIWLSRHVIFQDFSNSPV